MMVAETPMRTGLVRPQPLGIFDGPAGLLLVGPDADHLAADLAQGATPTAWPTDAAALAHAIDDDIDAALAALGPSPLDAINRLVLAPTAEHLDAARAAAAQEANLGVVVTAAAYASGLADQAPVVDGADGEFAVLALTVRAARALEFKDRQGAVRQLRTAVPIAAEVGPALHARVLGMLAEQLDQSPTGQQAAIELYDEALSLLYGTDLAEYRAALHLQRGLVAHQLADVGRHWLLEAIRSYQSALVGLNEERDSERFALANMNIAIAILSMPMTQASDQVKLGVAVQSLRAALRVYRPGTHPYEWSSCQMNLANALQYLPSTHREQNLEEAVQLYEEVLAARSPRSDALGYARVLANQANALAHLAVFDHAEAKYREARDLFRAAGDTEAVDVVERQLAQVAEQQKGRS